MKGAGALAHALSLVAENKSDNDNALSIGSKTTVAELIAQLADAVARRVVADLTADRPPELRDRVSKAQRLRISLSKLDRLCREGMPYVVVGGSRRFRDADVDA